jgi:beta-glucosidase/6-phospho-beta-glucosidase/beta-galactosidase
VSTFLAIKNDSDWVDGFSYAVTVFKAYNGRVKTWYTFNEPRVYCPQVAGFPFNESLAQGVNASTAPFHCSYNLVNAHVAAVRAFRELNISGEIAFKNDDFVGVPWRANSTEDQEAVERHAAFGIGMFSDVMYTTGDWPQVVKDTLGEDWLPRFTPEQIKENLGTVDFFAIDSYRAQYVAAPPGGIEACTTNPNHPLFPDCNVVMNFDSSTGGWAVGWTADTGTPWLQGTPRLIRGYFKELNRRWPFDKLYISEYGFTEPLERSFTELYQFKEDITRTTYFLTYLGEALLSIHEDGIPIAGAFSWAIMDNAEWNSGLSTRFGIQYVNYTTLERHYKRSAMALSEFFEAHGVFNAETNSSF